MRAIGVFQDFSFVGSGLARHNADGSIDRVFIIPHENRAQPRPTTLTIGTQYVFHHAGPVDDEELGIRTLPDRLRRLGMRVLRAPQSTKDMMGLYLGGPLFSIDFEDHGHFGQIFNQLDPKLSNESSKWAAEDFVLVYLK